MFPVDRRRSLEEYMASRSVRPRLGEAPARWSAGRLRAGPQPVIDLIADAPAQWPAGALPAPPPAVIDLFAEEAAPARADRYALRVDRGGIGYERRNFGNGVRRGHAGFYLYAMSYTDLPA